MEHARLATAADAGDLAELWRKASDETAQLRGGALLLARWGSDAIEGWLAGAASSDDQVLAVGETDGVAVGFVAAHLVETGLGRLGVVDAVYVEPPARQVGVGEVMMDLIERWCSERRCVGVDAPALPGSRAAKAFFEGGGFVTRLLVMHRPLGDSGV